VSARQQLRSALVRAGVPLRSTIVESATLPIVDRIRRCVASGLRDRVARLAPDGASYQSARNDDAGESESWHVHPDSVFFRGRLPALVVYGEAVTSGGKTLLRLVTPVSPEEVGM
jgi:hypothetical protein